MSSSALVPLIWKQGLTVDMTISRCAQLPGVFGGVEGCGGGGSVSVCACLSSLGDMSVCVSVCLFIVFEVHKVTVTFLF